MIEEDIIPLKLVMSSCATKEEMNANVAATVARGYTRLNEYLNSMLNRKVHLCGSGPSLKDTWSSIPAGEDVMAVNSAISYMIDNGLPPRWAMIWDASPLCANFAVPHADTTYLIGARCHPSVFERLTGCRVIVWHAGGDHNIKEYLNERGINEPMVNGGTAGITRGLYLAYALGYRDMQLYGCDSCYSGDDTHIRGSLVPEKDIRVFHGGKWFRTTPEWCAQIEEIKMIYPGFRVMGANIDAHGEGMMQYSISLMKSDEAGAFENAKLAAKEYQKQFEESQPLEEKAA